MKNLKLGDIVEYKVENEPYILAYRGSHLYSIIQLDVLGRFIAFSVPIGAQIQLIESSSMPVCEYKLLKEIGDFLKRVRFDIARAGLMILTLKYLDNIKSLLRSSTL